MRPGEKQGVQEDRLLYQRRAVQEDFKKGVQEMTGMELLDQLENVMIECEKAPKENTPTMKAFIILARVVYYLLRKEVRGR